MTTAAYIASALIAVILSILGLAVPAALFSLFCVALYLFTPLTGFGHHGRPSRLSRT